MNENKDPSDKLRPDTKSGPEQKGPFGKNYEGGIPANQPLVDALWELRGLEFKGGATYKAIAYGPSPDIRFSVITFACADFCSC